MTIEVPANDRTVRYLCSGGELQFDSDFPLFEDDDLKVVRDRAGTTSTLVLDTDYTVATIADDKRRVTLVAAAEDGDVIVLDGARQVERISQFATGDLRSSDINNEFARLVAVQQEIITRLSRNIAAPATDAAADLTLPPAASRASKWLGFDASGLPVAFEAPSDAGVNPRSAWALDTVYAIDDLTYIDGVVYSAKLAHTSTATDKPGIGASWETYWQVFVDGPLRPQGSWSTATEYSIGDYVERAGTTFACRVAHTSDAASEPAIGASWETYWQTLVGSAAVLSIFGRTGPVEAVSGDYSADLIAVTPTGGLAATDAQAAFAELDADLTSEATARANADAAEVTARDAAITSAVSAEATSRASADTALDGRVAAIEAVPVVSKVEAEAGVVTDVRSWTPERVAQAIAALAAGGGGGFTAPTTLRGLFTGQSNQLSNDANGVDYIDISSRVTVWDNAADISGAVGTGYVSPAVGSNPFETTNSYIAAMPFFCDRIAAEFAGTNILGTMVAQNGTAIEEWTDSAGATREMYDRILAVWTAQGGTDPYDFCDWMQGTSDNTDYAATSVADYKARFLDFVSDGIAAGFFTSDTVFILNSLPTDVANDDINTALQELADENSNCVYADNSKLELKADGFHFTGGAQAERGWNNAASAYLPTLGYTVPGFTPYAKAASISQSAATSCPTLPTQTTVNWQVEVEDIGGWYDAAAPTKLTVPKGITSVNVAADLKMSGATGSNGTIKLQHYGADDVLKKDYLDGFNYNSQYAGNIFKSRVAVTPGDYFIVLVLQNSGGTLTTDTTICTFSISAVA